MEGIAKSTSLLKSNMKSNNYIYFCYTVTVNGNKVSVSTNSFCLPHRPLSERDRKQNKREESHATFVSICRFFRFRDFLRTDAKLDRTHYCDKSWLSYHNYILLYVTVALRAGAIVGAVSSQEDGYGAVRF